MDKAAARKALMKLMRDAMPGVTEAMSRHRREMGGAHVTECQRRGLAGEPGWFFAREGALAIGTPWDEIADVAWWQATTQQVTVCLRRPDVPQWKAFDTEGLSNGA